MIPFVRNVQRGEIHRDKKQICGCPEQEGREIMGTLFLFQNNENLGGLDKLGDRSKKQQIVYFKMVKYMGM